MTKHEVHVWNKASSYTVFMKSANLLHLEHMCVWSLVLLLPERQIPPSLGVYTQKVTFGVWMRSIGFNVPPMQTQLCQYETMIVIAQRKVLYKARNSLSGWRAGLSGGSHTHTHTRKLHPGNWSLRTVWNQKSPMFS